MKRIAAIAIGMLMSAALVRAQETPVSQQSSNQSGTRFGIGVGFTPASLDSRAIFGVSDNAFSGLALPVSITMLLDFESFRLEPEFGVNSQTTERTGSTSGTLSATQTSFKVGLGAFGKTSPAPSANVVYGIRAGYLSVGSSSSGSGAGSTEISSSRPVITVAAALGGEYFVGRQFSFGAEVNFGYMSVGELSQTPSVPSSSKSTGAAFFTNAQLFGRFYFGQ